MTCAAGLVPARVPARKQAAARPTTVPHCGLVRRYWEVLPSSSRSSLLSTLSGTRVPSHSGG
eukprot:scaffold1067_cov253-Prasinococcus_capsulatus_cf.AAC.4